MKLKAILNGIAALLAVGMFYTFSFCMVSDVNDEDISIAYSVSTEEEFDSADAPLKSDETSESSQSKNNTVKSLSAVYIPSAAPKSGEIVLEKTDNADESISCSGLSAEEIDALFSDEKEEKTSEDEIVTAKGSSTVSAAASGTKLTESSEKTAKKKSKAIAEKKVSETENENSDDNTVAKQKSNSATIEIDEEGNVSGDSMEDSVQSEPFPTVDDTYSFGDIVNASGNTLSATGTVDEEGKSGITVTAKVHGEVQEFDAFELTCMIVANEMSPSFCTEALKAQAVAAYSYVMYHQDRGLIPTVLVKEEVPENIREIVLSVWGQCCYYNGRIAQTVYTASSSGFTADAANVWGGSSVPYLISKETPFDADYDPNYGVTASFTEDDVRQRLEKYLGITLSDDPNNWIKVTGYVDGNYVSSINIDDQAQITGAQMREKVMKYKIKSTSFTVSYADGMFTFTTYGYGHGVGMSQNGANILARQGYTYIDILKFYYEGITVE